MIVNFNKELFADLLIKAKGNRSINQYANDIKVSPAHISRLIRKMLNSPPSPETIKKFAQSAYNGITYESLMQASGYLSKITSNNRRDITKLTEEEKIEYIEIAFHILAPKLAKILVQDNSLTEIAKYMKDNKN